MAERAQPVSGTRIVLGGAALAALLFFTLGTTVAVWSLSFEAGAGLHAADWAAIRFTLSQAAVSATLSVVLAIPVARVLARRHFVGRGLIVAFLGAPFILPNIVAVLGIVAVWGRSGLISDAFAMLGLQRVSIYGFHGVVLAHVFFNLPLATRLLLQGWQAIPAEHFRLAGQLGLSTRDVNRWLERPMLRTVLPGAFLLIFLLCLSSFAVALALGGGPKATTVELAIYQALRFDFDLSKAAVLAMVQFALCLGTAAITVWIALPASFALGLDRPQRRFDVPLFAFVDTLIVVVAALFLFVPLITILVRGLPPLFALPGQIWLALLRSLIMAICSALLATSMALALASLITALQRQRKRVAGLTEGTSFLALAASPFVIGTGLFILINPIANPFALAAPITVAVNAIMALPFSLRIMLPALTRAERTYGKLGRSLGMTRWVLFRLAIWPRIRPAVGFATGLAAALAMGDLGVVTLFAPPDFATLPLMMYRLMGAYQMDAASGAALLLLSSSLGLFWLFDRGGRV